MGCKEGVPGDDGEGLDDAFACEAVRHFLYGCEGGPRVVRVGGQLVDGNTRGFVVGCGRACRRRRGLASEGGEAGGAAAHGLGYGVEGGRSAESVGFAHVSLRAISRMWWAWSESGA